MNQNYNIKLNSKQPSSDEIAKHMDFDGLLAQFEDAAPVNTRPARVRRLVYYSTAAAAAVVVGIVIALNLFIDNGVTLTEEAYFQQQAFVNPPISEEVKSAQFASYQVNANQGGIYEYESGSRLIVPAAAFADDRGNIIQGEVNIRYREYHDFVDFYLSGIPMTYDSAGVRYTFESAGMMEIYAEFCFI